MSIEKPTTELNVPAVTVRVEVEGTVVAQAVAHSKVEVVASVTTVLSRTC